MACRHWGRLDSSVLRANGGVAYQTYVESRQLGKSGLHVPVLCFGTGTFGGGSEFFRAWGETDVAEATHLIDISLEAGVNFFYAPAVHSQGLSQDTLALAIQHLPLYMLLITTNSTS